MGKGKGESGRGERERRERGRGKRRNIFSPVFLHVSCLTFHIHVSLFHFHVSCFMTNFTFSFFHASGALEVGGEEDRHPAQAGVLPRRGGQCDNRNFL